MIGNGQSLDLLKLFSVVRERGGYDAVSSNGLWGSVADECGMGSGLAPSVKLVCFKYLGALKRWLETVVCAQERGILLSGGANKGGDLTLVGSEFEFAELVRKFLHSSKVVLDASVVHMGNTCLADDDKTESGRLEDGAVRGSILNSVSDRSKEYANAWSVLVSNTRVSTAASDKSEGKIAVAEVGGCASKVDEGDCQEIDPETFNSSRKRKRESSCKILDWVTAIARNPGDPIVGSLPERSNWSSAGHQEMWKKVLLARKELFMKRSFESTIEQTAWQNCQRMHPCMYDDHIGSSYNFRNRFQCTKNPRLNKSLSQAQAGSPGSSSASQTYPGSCMEGNSDVESSTRNSILDLPADKCIPLGPRFQAEVPEWTGVISESDSKWIGTRVWPLVDQRKDLIIEREPIGKGRQDSCGCQAAKSIECVRFHCTERKLGMKRELGMAFYHWGFDKMGEEVHLLWTKEQEKKFKDIVKSNPLSRDRCFWHELRRYFTAMKERDLASYYFNVFLLRRRAHQNRYTPNDINSDDDESEYRLVTKGSGNEGVKSPGSLLSAKKQRKS